MPPTESSQYDDTADDGSVDPGQLPHDTYASECREHVPGTPAHMGGRCPRCDSEVRLPRHIKAREPAKPIPAMSWLRGDPNSLPSWRSRVAMAVRSYDGVDLSSRRHRGVLVMVLMALGVTTLNLVLNGWLDTLILFGITVAFVTTYVLGFWWIKRAPKP